MTKRTVFLSLGSNLDDRESNLQTAIRALRRLGQVDAISSLYETEPYGVTDQPGFLNLALALSTDLPPHDLLTALKRLEQDIGRRSTYRWGPRVIDIDIVLDGDLVLDAPDLTIPHRDMANRAFVLEPLAEIAPHAVHPVLRAAVARLRDGAPDRESVRRYHSPKRSSSQGSPSLW